jgi:hypothetical protein
MLKLAIPILSLAMAAPVAAADYRERVSQGGYVARGLYDYYRAPGVTIIPGPAQSPGCGGLVDEYPCPPPMVIPDNGGYN